MLPWQRERIQAMVSDLTGPFRKGKRSARPDPCSELSKLYVQLIFVPVREHTPRRMAALLHAAQLPRIFIPFKGNIFIYFHLLSFISCLQTVKYFEWKLQRKAQPSLNGIHIQPEASKTQQGKIKEHLYISTIFRYCFAGTVTETWKTCRVDAWSSPKKLQAICHSPEIEVMTFQTASCTEQILFNSTVTVFYKTSARRYVSCINASFNFQQQFSTTTTLSDRLTHFDRFEILKNS